MLNIVLRSPYKCLVAVRASLHAALLPSSARLQAQVGTPVYTSTMCYCPGSHLLTHRLSVISVWGASRRPCHLPNSTLTLVPFPVALPCSTLIPLSLPTCPCSSCNAAAGSTPFSFLPTYTTSPYNSGVRPATLYSFTFQIESGFYSAGQLTAKKAEFYLDSAYR